MFLQNGQFALSLQSKGSLYAISKGNGVRVPDCLAAVSSFIAPDNKPLPRKGWEGVWERNEVRRPAFSSMPRLAEAPRCKGSGAMSNFFVFKLAEWKLCLHTCRSTPWESPLV